MAERIASGEIHVEVNDQKAIADLRRIDAEFDRTMDHIDRQHAEASVGANLKELKKDLAQAEAMVKDFEKKRAEATTTAERRSTATRLANARKQQAALRDELNAQESILATKRKQNAADALAAKQTRAIEVAERKRNAVLAQAERRRASAARAEARDLERAERQQARINTQVERRTAAWNKEAASIPRVLRQYAELEQSIKRLDRVRARTGGAARDIIDLKISEKQAQLEEFRRIAERHHIELPVDIHPSSRAAAELREILQGRGIRAAAAAGGAMAASAFSANFRRRFSREGAVNLLGNALSRAGSVLGGLSQMTVRLGPFTATLRQLGVAMAVFAPTILDVVGALGSLVSVVGAAALGVGALGAGLLGGAIPGFIGLFAVIKPITKEFGSAMKASKAYNDAIAKGNTDLAKKKLAELNAVLGNVDKRTKDNFKSAGALSGRWKDLTAPARTAAFKVIGEGLGFANRNLGLFARNTNTLAGALGGGIQRLIRGLDTTALSTMMRNFNASVGPAVDGVANLLKYLMRVGAVASTQLPSLARAFRNWSQDILGTTNNTEQFRAKILRLIDTARSLGRFFMAAGRFIVSFFAPGIDAGVRLTDTMTAALNRWTEFNRSAQGRQDLAGFFQRSVTGAQQLYNALAPLISAFVEWAANLSPVVSAFLRGVSAVTSFTAALLNLTHLIGPVSTLATTLGALWAIGRISAATRAVSGFGAALLGLGGARAAAGKGAAAGVGLIDSAAAGAAAGGLTRVGKAAEGAAKKGSLLKRILTFGGPGAAAATFNPWIAGGVALGVVLLSLKKGGSDAKKGFYDAANAANRSAEAYRNNVGSLADMASQSTRANMSVREAKRALSQTKKGTDDYKLALLNLRDAQRSAFTVNDQYNNQRREQGRLAVEQYDRERKVLKTFQDGHAAERERLQDIVKFNQNAEQRANAQQRLNMLNEKEAPILARVEAAHNRVAASALNLQRAARFMLPVVGQAEQALGRLARVRPNLAQKIAVKFEAPKDVGAVANAARRALAAGGGIKAVMKIVADSKNAEDALRRLRAISLPAKTQRILESGGQAAINMLQKIIGRKLTPKEQRIAQAGGPGVIALLQRILRIKIPEKRFAVNAMAAQAIGAINTVKGLLGSLQSKDIYVTTHLNQVISKKRAGPAASGHKAGASGMKLVGEGGGPEILADHKTGALSVVDKPTLLAVDRNTSVIPTEDKYRTRGADLWTKWAADMGIPAYRAGRPAINKPSQKSKRSLSDYGKGQARGQAKSLVAHTFAKRRYHYDSKEYPGVLAAERAVDIQQRDIQTQEMRTKEPDSFIMQTGTDAEGNPVYSINQGVIDSYSAELNHLADMYQTYMDLLQALRVQVVRARKRTATIMATSRSNITRLLGAIHREDNIIEGKGVSTSRKQAARERKGIYKQVLTDEQASFANAERDNVALRARLDELDHTDIPQAQITMSEYRADAAAVAGRAAAEAASANPEATKPGAAAAEAGVSPDQEAINAQATAQGYQAGLNRAVGVVSQDVLNGPGDIGMGFGTAAGAAAAGSTAAKASNPAALSPPVAGGGGLNITINTLHPGDPATLQAIGSAATSGMGFQSARPSTYGNLGL